MSDRARAGRKWLATMQLRLSRGDDDTSLCGRIGWSHDSCHMCEYTASGTRRIASASAGNTAVADLLSPACAPPACTVLLPRTLVYFVATGVRSASAAGYCMMEYCELTNEVDFIGITKSQSPQSLGVLHTLQSSSPAHESLTFIA